MNIQENKSLKPYNTFGIDVKARYFAEARSIDDLREVLSKFKHENTLLLGGGSNMLLTENFDGLVLKVSLEGKEIIERNEQSALVSAMAGENWHDFVLWTLEQNLGGLENMSLIPGNVGTAPIQNIGAYGVELKDSFVKLEALELSSGELKEFKREDCKFDYRSSYFKYEGKGQFIITRVWFRLTAADHVLNTSYGAIEAELKQLAGTPDIHSVSQAVINIRRRKLPDPAEIGNSGSFFKNPTVDAGQYETLKTRHPELVAYELPGNQFKLAAGWLIEQAGWKGYRKGDAGVHRNQALVLVNYENASGSEIKELAMAIKKSVFRTFAVDLEAEVNII